VIRRRRPHDLLEHPDDPRVELQAGAFAKLGESGFRVAAR
jgi:hypothetical protein